MVRLSDLVTVDHARPLKVIRTLFVSNWVRSSWIRTCTGLVGSLPEVPGPRGDLRDIGCAGGGAVLASEGFDGFRIGWTFTRIFSPVIVSIE